MLGNLMPHGLLGLTVAGIAAALMGHISATYNSISTLVTRDIFMKFRPDADSATQIRVGRLLDTGQKIGLAVIPSAGLFSDLVAANARGIIHRPGYLPGKLQVVFGSCGEKRCGLDDQIHPFEIHVAAIHHIEGSRLEKQIVEPAHVVLAGGRDEDACGNRPSQVDLLVHLDPSLGLSEIRPREESQGQIDSRGIERVNRVGDVEPEILPGVEWPGFAHQGLGQVLPQPPVALFVRIGQSGPGYRFPEAKVVKSLGPCIQAIDDIPQPFPPRQLSKSHADELLATAEMSDARLRTVALHQAGKRLPVHQVEDLRKDVAASVHGRKGWQDTRRSSNPSHRFCRATRSFYEPSEIASFS